VNEEGLQRAELYRFGAETGPDADGVRGFSQEGALVPADWPEFPPHGQPAGGWPDGARVEEHALPPTTRFCVHNDTATTDHPGGDYYRAGEPTTYLPRTDEPGTAGSPMALYFLPDGSASGSFLVVVAGREGTFFSAVRVERIGGRIVEIAGFAPGGGGG
jgi:hypothetical protein